MISFGERCYSNQYDEVSDDKISGFANTAKLPTTKFPPHGMTIRKINRKFIH